MTSVTTRIRVAKDGTLTGRAPTGVPAGEHDAVIRVENGGRPFDVTHLPTIDLGPWPADLGLRRENMYDDDGR
jgi:hypothetical protein